MKYGKLDENGNLKPAPYATKVDGWTKPTDSLTEEEANAAGYMLVVDEPPECEADEYAVATGLEERDGRICCVYEVVKREPAPRRFSKLRIILAAKDRGKWEALKGWIEAQGLSDEWAACQFVQSDYPGFADICEMLISAGVLTEDEVDGILAEAEEKV